MSASWRRRCWLWEIALAQRSVLSVQHALMLSLLGVSRAITLTGCFASAFSGSRVVAQIIPDATLGAERSVTTPNTNVRGLPADLIEGGAARGVNLFHSFAQFNVGEGSRVYFANPTGIENIFTRVIGSNLSNILGTLGVNGGANLFLLNPNGIIFGPNARLDASSSFVGSTASSLVFANGTQFSATNPQSPPLLTINVPIGLQYGSNPGRIVNQSRAPSLVPLPLPYSQLPISSTVGLQVLPGRTLALVGGEVALLGGNVTALQGRIELGAVAGNSLVSITPTANGFALGYEGVQNFQNILLSQQAASNASGLGGGAIQVQGAQVTLTGGSAILADTFGSYNGTGIQIEAKQLTVGDGAFVSASTFGAGAGGNLSVVASESVELIGQGSFNLLAQLLTGTFNPISDRANGLFTLSGGAGVAGNITINTSQLTLRDGAVGLATTFLAGQGGNLSVTASESVELINSGLLTGTAGSGTAGNLSIDTGKLIVRDGAVVGTSTLNTGAGGTIKVKADAIELRGTPANALVPTGIFATTDSGTGAGGDITIDTRQLILRDGTGITTTTGRLSRNGIISTGGRGGNLVVNASEKIELTGISADGRFQSILGTTTFSASPAGDLRISTGKLILRDGAVVSTATVGAGQGGKLTVSASELVELSGTSVDGRSRSSLEATSGSAFFPIAATGNAEDLRIATRELIVRDGAQVAVASLGSGKAGNIEVVADSIRLDNRGTISAATVSGEGGNIALQVQDLILMRNKSEISTEAGGTGNGGNIDVDSRFIVAVPNEDSNIIANAFKGRGGNINITTQGIFGIEFHPRLTPQSDITASSEFGINGTVQINTPGIDPNRGLAQLPTNVVDATGLIDRRCTVAGGTAQTSSFTVTGRGGLPPNPNETLNEEDLLEDLGTPAVVRDGARGGQPTAAVASANTAPNRLVEAQGWIIGADGKVILTAQAPTATPQHPWQTPASCQAVSKSAETALPEYG